MYSLDIQPRTRKVIEVLIGDLNVDCEGCIEPILFNGSPVLIACSLNCVLSRVTLIEVMNRSEEPVRVEKDQNLASFLPSWPVSVVSVSPSDGGDCKNLECGALFDLSHTDLVGEQKQFATKFLNSYSDVTGKDELDMGCTSTISHRIDVQNANPVKQKYRRFDGNLRKEIKNDIDKLRQRGIIKQSSSSWALPLVPVRKKNGQLRSFVDFRVINSKTRKDSFLLPNLSDAVSQFKKYIFHLKAFWPAVIKFHLMTSVKILPL